MQGHVGRLQEASLVCDSVTNYPARRPPHTPTQGIKSITKRAPPPSAADAEGGGRYTTVLEVVRSTDISQVSQYLQLEML